MSVPERLLVIAEQELGDLNVAHVDLLLVHHRSHTSNPPVPVISKVASERLLVITGCQTEGDMEKVWSAMEAAKQAGKA